MLAGKQRRVFYSSAKTEVNYFPLSWCQRLSMVAHMQLGGVGMMLLGVPASPRAVHYQELMGKMLVVDAGTVTSSQLYQKRQPGPTATVWGECRGVL